MEYVLLLILMLIGAFFYILIEEHFKQKYWEKKCSKCNLGPYHCLNCRRFRHLTK
jgi:hypothetical protein